METKPNSPQHIIADSSALVSLIVTTDTNNIKARLILTEVSKAEYAIIVILSEVFAESINLLGKKFSHAQAIEAASLFLNADIFIIAPTTAVMRQNALKKFGVMPKGVSYTDCLVMAVADLHGTSVVFGFDDIFRKSGYQLPAS